MKGLQGILEARQVPIYFVAIAIGAIIGALVPGMTALEAAISPALAVMLFATFMQVPLAEIGASFRNIRFIAALVVTNFMALPMVAAGLLQFLPEDPMLRLAVLFVLLTPCIDYVITFTRLGGGNAQSLLAMTPMLLALQMLLLPLYLALILGSNAGHLIEARPFVKAFVGLIVLPLLAAGLLQWSGKRGDKAAHVATTLDLLPVPATAAVLFIVVASVMPQIGLARHAALSAAPIYVAFGVVAPLVWCRCTPHWMGSRKSHARRCRINARCVVFRCI